MVANHLKVGGEDVGEWVEVGKDGFASRTATNGLTRSRVVPNGAK